MADKLIKKYLDGQIVSLTNNLEELAKIDIIRGIDGQDAINNISLIKINFIKFNKPFSTNLDINYENVLDITVKYKNIIILNKEYMSINDNEFSIYFYQRPYTKILRVSFDKERGNMLSFSLSSNDFIPNPQDYTMYITYTNKIDKEITV